MGDVALEGFGAGGAALNFKVVPGLTQPGTAAENTIWVKTESLTGWIIDASQPEELTEGMVWISAGTKSAVEFNALKKNGIQVYPLSAKQMIGGALVDVEAVSYQGGEWVDWWNGDLYKQGDLYEHISGGWVVMNAAGGSGAITEDKVIQLRYRSNASSDQHSTAYTNKKIDLTKHTKLTMEVDVIAVGSSKMNASICICNTNTDGYPVDGRVAFNSTPQGQTGVFTVELDIASYSSEYYIAAWAMYCNADVIEIELS